MILLDRVMRQYGPEASEARDLLQRYTALKIALTWPEKNAAEGPRLDDPIALAMLEDVQAKLLALTPQNEAQRWLQSRALQIGGELTEDRWLLAAEDEGSVPRPFLATLVFWLTILFTAFGLFAPRHATVVAALLVCALSLSVADLPDPGDGSTVVGGKLLDQLGFGIEIAFGVGDQQADDPRADKIESVPDARVITLLVSSLR